MDLNKVNIEKLPADVRKTFKRLQLLHAEKKIQNKAKNDFLSFVKCMWPDFVEGSHHRHIADKFNKLASGEINRLIVNMPPRHTKSEFASFCYQRGWWAVIQSSRSFKQRTQENSPCGLVVKQNILSTQKIIEKFLQQHYKKTPRLQADGKRHKVVNTSLLV